MKAEVERRPPRRRILLIALLFVACNHETPKEAKIKAVIADDELLARKFIRRILKQDPEIEIVGECSNGQEAVAMIRKQQPDVVFLDIQMPEMDGFKVLETLGLDHLPEIVFTTAYESYAIRAFELHALDYLLKPFD